MSEKLMGCISSSIGQDGEVEVNTLDGKKIEAWAHLFEEISEPVETRIHSPHIMLLLKRDFNHCLIFTDPQPKDLKALVKLLPALYEVQANVVDSRKSVQAILRGRKRCLMLINTRFKDLESNNFSKNLAILKRAGICNSESEFELARRDLWEVADNFIDQGLLSSATLMRWALRDYLRVNPHEVDKASREVLQLLYKRLRLPLA